jgi:hypothetical protein
VWVAERPFSSLPPLPKPLPPRPLPLVEGLEVGVLAFLREEEGVLGPEIEEVEREMGPAWAFIFERRWVMALGVTSVGEEGG